MRKEMKKAAALMGGNGSFRYFGSAGKCGRNGSGTKAGE